MLIAVVALDCMQFPTSPISSSPRSEMLLFTRDKKCFDLPFSTHYSDITEAMLATSYNIHINRTDTRDTTGGFLEVFF